MTNSYKCDRMYEQCCTQFMPCLDGGIFSVLQIATFSLKILRDLLCFTTDAEQTEVDYFGYSG